MTNILSISNGLSNALNNLDYVDMEIKKITEPFIYEIHHRKFQVQFGLLTCASNPDDDTDQTATKYNSNNNFIILPYLTRLTKKCFSLQNYNTCIQIYSKNLLTFKISHYLCYFKNGPILFIAQKDLQNIDKFDPLASFSVTPFIKQPIRNTINLYNGRSQSVCTRCYQNSTTFFTTDNWNWCNVCDMVKSGQTKIVLHDDYNHYIYSKTSIIISDARSIYDAYILAPIGNDISMELNYITKIRGIFRITALPILVL